MKRILVFGDSHSEVFRCMSSRQSNFIFDVTTVGGATAYGLNNNDSKSRSWAIFSEKLKGDNSYDYVLIGLGEVDCSYLIWARSKKHHITLKKSTQQSLENLFRFIKETISVYFKSDKIVLLGVNLPAVDNASCLLPDRKLLTEVGQCHATFLTLCFNQKLKEFAEKNNHKYADIVDSLMDQETNLVQKKFCIPCNNHLNMKLIFPFWLKKISCLP